MSGHVRPASTTEAGRLAHYVDDEHEARHAASLRTQARLAELRALTPQGRIDLYGALREEYREIAGVTWGACARRSRIRRDLTLLEMLGREARQAGTRANGRRSAPSE